MNGDQLYAWQTLEDDGWGLISAFIPGLGHAVLVCRSLDAHHRLGLFAVAHHDATGLPVRGVRLDVVEVLREMP